MPFSLEISRDAEHYGEVANVVTPVLIAIQEVLVFYIPVFSERGYIGLPKIIGKSEMSSLPVLLAKQEMNAFFFL